MTIEQPAAQPAPPATPTPHSELFDPELRAAVAALLLATADDELVVGWWDSEWTGIAPMLEEDVATSSMAQDEIGHANALYGLLAALTDDDPDRIAYGREPDAYRHAALLNHARGDWAFTVARRWLYDSADAVRLEALSRSSWPDLANLVVKIRREEAYHRMHTDAWLERLAAAGGEARERLQQALVRLWDDAQAVFAPIDDEHLLVEDRILPEPMSELRDRWLAQVTKMLAALGLAVPDAAPPSSDGRRRRTDDFAWLHAQLTMVARSEEGAQW